MSETAIVPVSFDDTQKVAAAMVKSGYFQDAREVAQAIVKILAGQELGIGPFQSMQSIFIISGRPSMSANLMAAKVKSSRRYNYKVVELTDAVCEIAFLEEGKEIGRSRFTAEDAKKAGTKNLDRYPRNMLFARAMSNGVRWYCPDVLGGAPMYTPEELGAEVNEDGNIIDMPSPRPPAASPAPAPAREAKIMGELGFESPQVAAAVEAGGVVAEEQTGSLPAWQMDSQQHPYDEMEVKNLAFHLNGLLKHAEKSPLDLQKIEYLQRLIKSRQEKK